LRGGGFHHAEEAVIVRTTGNVLVQCLAGCLQILMDSIEDETAELLFH